VVARSTVALGREYAGSVDLVEELEQCDDGIGVSRHSVEVVVGPKGMQ
jgi:hypothetical protein